MILIYRFLTFFFYPILIVLIYFRKLLNKEDHYRYKEKIFPSNFFPEKDNKKKLIWFHAASIGETQSIFPLIQKLNTEIEDVEFLITTTTLSAGNIIAKKLYNHKYVSGQGFFSIDKKNVVDEKSIYTVITKPSQGIIFHPLMLHRSVPRDPKNLRPRYTVDIRYFDTNYNPKFNVDLNILLTYD